LLLELRVKDLGIIDDLDWKLEAGFNVITGETGAGKSLVIDAIELLLIASAREDVIRTGADEADIEGVFILSDDTRFVPLKEFLSNNGLTADDDILIIQCVIRKQKPAVVRINRHVVTKTILRQIGQFLVDIHGQSEHLSLLDKQSHLAYLDAYTHNSELKKDLASRFTDLNKIETELSNLRAKEKDAVRLEEYLRYQIDEIKKADLRVNEDDELEKERHVISHAEKLKEYSSLAYQALSARDTSHDSNSILSKLNESVHAMKKLTELDPVLKTQMEYLEKTVYGIEETARDIQHYCDNLKFDPERLEAIEIRLEGIRNLKRKYGKTIKDILSYLEKAEKDLEGIAISSERRLQLEKERAGMKEVLGHKAEELSLKRREAALKLTEDVKNELADLDMSQMRFEVAVTQVQSAEGVTGSDGKTYLIGPNGIDQVEFMVSTNPGEPLKPLARIASTGEMSRFTLALKGVLSQADLISVLVFDEIDIGVGGRSGNVIGKKLWNLSQNHQVICVTHLPQIAAYADAHYYVHKSIAGSRTTSTLERLDNEQRLNEIALMLGGAGYTQTARKNAAELLGKAAVWKKPAGQPPDKPTQLSF
jgi:DNA repair protein RecN (Recombination protein N)